MDNQAKKEINRIIEQIKNGYRPQKIILYGSFAYGSPKKNSDVDLIVIKITKERFVRRMMRMAEMVKSSLGADILVYTPREWKEALDDGDYFIKEVARKGKVIYAS